MRHGVLFAFCMPARQESVSAFFVARPFAYSF
jgi:hypothetical protein